MNSKIIVNGIKWAGIEFAFGFAFRFLIKLLLAKLLLPKDFGLVGMTTIFIAVITAASELGVGAALIQKKDNNNAKRLYNTAFWSGLVWGIGLYLIMCFAIGPAAAAFYKEPILIKLIPVLSIGICLKPLNLIHTVILTRSMNFKKIALINNSSALVAGIVALFSAYHGFGVWALAVNNFLMVVLTVPLLFLTTKWIPTLEWNKLYFKEIFSFGMYSTGTSVFSSVTYNMDNLMIGKMSGATSLGAYSLAFSLTEILRQAISSILNKVMYPVYGQLQDNKERLKNYFIRVISLNAIIMYPLMVFLLLFGQYIILDFFGDKWTVAIMPLKVLALAVMVHLIINSFTSLLRGLGYPSLEFKILLSLTLLILLPGLYIGIKFYGLIGATLAILVNKICLVIVALVVLKKHIKLKIMELINTLKGTVLSICIAALVACSLDFTKYEDYWILQSIIYFQVYTIVIYFMEKETFKFLRQKLR